MLQTVILGNCCVWKVRVNGWTEFSRRNWVLSDSEKGVHWNEFASSFLTSVAPAPVCGSTFAWNDCLRVKMVVTISPCTCSNNHFTIKIMSFAHFSTFFFKAWFTFIFLISNLLVKRIRKRNHEKKGKQMPFSFKSFMSLHIWISSTQGRTGSRTLGMLVRFWGPPSLGGAPLLIFCPVSQFGGPFSWRGPF